MARPSLIFSLITNTARKSIIYLYFSHTTDSGDNITAIPFISSKQTGSRYNRYNGARGPFRFPTPLTFGQRLETVAYVSL